MKNLANAVMGLVGLVMVILFLAILLIAYQWAFSPDMSADPGPAVRMPAPMPW